MKSFAVGLCVLFMAGCSGVTLKEPFPKSQLTEQEQKQLTGTWLMDDTVIHIEFTSNGVPWLATVDWEDNDFRLEKSRLYFTKRNDTLYVCMPTEPNNLNEYLFAEIKPDGNDLIAWGPDADYFGKMVENGTLKGSVERGEHSTRVELETPAGEILELIATNPAAIDYKTPLFFQKLD